MEPINYPVPSDYQLAPDYGPPLAWPAQFAATPLAPVPAPDKPKRSRLRTALGGLALAGLLVVGGAATVFAADPTPSPSTSPGVTQPAASPGTTDGTQSTPGTKADCPHDQTTTDDTNSTDSSS